VWIDGEDGCWLYVVVDDTMIHLLPHQKKRRFPELQEAIDVVVVDLLLLLEVGVVGPGHHQQRMDVVRVVEWSVDGHVEEILLQSPHPFLESWISIHLNVIDDGLIFTWKWNDRDGAIANRPSTQRIPILPPSHYPHDPKHDECVPH
jgi:hypothetical protein